MNDAMTPWRWLGLQRHPFPPTPDAAAYFMTPGLMSDYEELRHCILARKGIVLVSGEVGLGKTTLVRRLMLDLERAQAVTAMVFNTFLQEQALLDAIARDFGLTPATDMAQTLARLNALFLDVHARGQVAVLIIDDAQNLAPASLELIRLLSNLETAQEKLLQIVLVGQPELVDTLQSTQLRQLISRVVKHVRLQGLSQMTLARYVEFRLNAAGAGGTITVAPAAYRALYRQTQGNLRRVHLILDRCLYGLVARQQRYIDETLLLSASADAGMTPKPKTSTRRRRLVLTTGLLTAGGLVWSALSLVGTMPGTWFIPATATAPAETTAGLAPADASVATTPSGQVTNVRSAEPAITADDTKKQPPEDTPAIGTAPACAYDLMHGVGDGGQLVWYAMPPSLSPEELPNELCRWTMGDSQYIAAIEYPKRWYSDQPTPQVRQLQRRLRVLGHDYVILDGMMGPMTERALREFQRRHDLVPTGRPDALTLLLLMREPT